jgi:GH24 family phage-related lysozyme (muramidase)
MGLADSGRFGGYINGDSAVWPGFNSFPIQVRSVLRELPSYYWGTIKFSAAIREIIEKLRTGDYLGAIGALEDMNDENALKEAALLKEIIPDETGIFGFSQEEFEGMPESAKTLIYDLEYDYGPTSYNTVDIIKDIRKYVKLGWYSGVAQILGTMTIAPSRRKEEAEALLKLPDTGMHYSYLGKRSLVQFIKEAETSDSDDPKYLKLYKDNEGNYTIGYGHYIPDTNPEEIEKYRLHPLKDEAAAEELLVQDLDLSATYFKNYSKGYFYPYKLSQNQYDAVLDFIFHFGPGRYEYSKLRGLLKNFLDTGIIDRAKFVDAFTQYDGKDPGQTNRSLNEAELFLDNKYGGYANDHSTKEKLCEKK